jgi:pyocin large subunit-like protein
MRWATGTLRRLAATACVAGLAGAAGCDAAPSAVETRPREAAEAGAEAVVAAAQGGPATAGAAAPLLTANRRETVDEKTRRLFERNGAAFGAATPEAYLAQVEAFTRRPPADVERVTRPTGDVLLYQASTNTFAVVDAEGVPRTMFKPDDGPAYWAEQKARAPTFGQGGGAGG